MLTETMDIANENLRNLEQDIGRYQEAYSRAFEQQLKDFKRAEVQRRAVVQERMAGTESQMFAAMAESAGMRGDTTRQLNLSTQAKVIDIQSNFRQQIRELIELKRTSEITADEFDRMRKSALDLNNQSLSNIREELKRTFAEAAVNAFAATPSSTRREARRQLRTIEGNFREARAAGLLSEGQEEDFRSALSGVRGAINNRSSDTSLLRRVAENRDNPFFNQLLSQAGRGDIIQMANLANPESAIDATAVNLTRDMNTVMATNFQPVVERLDRINATLENSLNSPRTLNVSAPDAVGAAAQIYSDMSKNKARSADL